MPTTDDSAIAALLTRARIIAMVGASDRPERPAHAVMAFLQRQGFRVIPVNPGLAGQSVLGETVRASLSDIAEPIDMVDVFRRSEFVAEIVAEAIAAGAAAVWMQLDLVDHTAAAAAEAAGLTVVVDRCPKIEWQRLRLARPANG